MNFKEIIERTKDKITTAVTHGKSLESEIQRLDLQAKELVAADTNLKESFLTFATEIKDIEANAVKLGSQALFESCKELYEVNSAILNTAQMMEHYEGIIDKQMSLEKRWLAAFEKFEVHANKFYKFALDVANRKFVGPEIEKRVEAASRKVAVAMGVLARTHRNIGQKFVPFDTYLPVDKTKREKYAKEFEERRREFLSSLDKKGN
jgi:hypothetical protein